MFALPLLPYVITSETLHSEINNPKLLIVEVGTLGDYESGHIPGAVHLDTNKLKLAAKPSSGLPPKQIDLEKILSEVGVSNNKHVIAYDHENGSAASRLLWTLEYTNQNNHSFLDGGMTAWKALLYEVEKTPNQGIYMPYYYQPNNNVLAEKNTVLDNLNNSDTIILDARSAKEYTGVKSASKRFGHILGAISFNYLDSIDSNTKKFLPKAELRVLLEQTGITKDKKIIVYCQTYQRAAQSFVMLRELGYPRVLGYAGSWAEWGNDYDLPIEQNRPSGLLVK